MILESLEALKERRDLSRDQMVRVMEAFMTGRASDDEIEVFLVNLREKGETVDEIVSASLVLRDHVVRLSRAYPDLLDTCGTGGDNLRTFNISTLAALTACAAGAMVAKHGNRALSSVCGSADLLEMFGVEIQLDPALTETQIEATGFGFLFAPLYHPAVKHVMNARRKIRGKTLFNILGPLANPASAGKQLLGVFEEGLVEKMGQALLRLGADRALVVHGAGGLDEISLWGDTKIAEIDQGKMRVYTVSPKELGFDPAGTGQIGQITCDSKEASKKLAIDIMSNETSVGADMVCLNAGAALYAAKKARSIAEGICLARSVLASGKVREKLQAIASVSQKLKQEGVGA